MTGRDKRERNKIFWKHLPFNDFPLEQPLVEIMWALSTLLENFCRGKNRDQMKKSQTGNKGLSASKKSEENKLYYEPKRGVAFKHTCHLQRKRKPPAFSLPVL